MSLILLPHTFGSEQINRDVISGVIYASLLVR